MRRRKEQISSGRIIELAEKQFKSPGETRRLSRMVQGLFDSLNESTKRHELHCQEAKKQS